MASTKPHRRSPVAKAQRPPDTGPTEALTHSRLRRETEAFHGTGGVSAKNRKSGFEPAIVNAATSHTYRS